MREHVRLGAVPADCLLVKLLSQGAFSEWVNQLAQGEEYPYETPAEDHDLPSGVSNRLSPPGLPIADYTMVYGGGMMDAQTLVTTAQTAARQHRGLHGAQRQAAAYGGSTGNSALQSPYLLVGGSHGGSYAAPLTKTGMPPLRPQEP